MDTEAHTVLWKWSHPRTMQSFWPSSPGSHKSGRFSRGLTLDPSNTRPVLTVSQAFISHWPLNTPGQQRGKVRTLIPNHTPFPPPEHFTPWHQCVLSAPGCLLHSALVQLWCYCVNFITFTLSSLGLGSAGPWLSLQWITGYTRALSCSALNLFYIYQIDNFL